MINGSNMFYLFSTQWLITDAHHDSTSKTQHSTVPLEGMHAVKEWEPVLTCYTPR